MANFPTPIGIDRMLLDIAQGIGGAAKTLPEASRSAVGAVALKRATVQIDFELSSGAVREDNLAGLGVKTFLFGFGTSSETRADLATNRGRIELEIVSILDPEATAGDDTGANGKVDHLPAGRDRAELRAAIGLLQAEVAGLAIPDADRDRLTTMLKEASSFLAHDELDRAAAVIRGVERDLQALAGPRGANDT
ncbi:MAG: hypothetical protein KDJ86_06415 [Bauldia sp.]|uniref:hypothetical protein n=1 Tax=Bauldia sp. TaxID=2575872 RepID=UPI001D76F362|nr:hypothetical protein [Bauldia sp.]MCB1495399.1 hypothetical protein [Bauldia sp.]